MKTNFKKTTIKQATRKMARDTVKTLKLAGKIAFLIDNGRHLNGSDRWAVETYTEQRKTLVSPQ